MIYLTLSEGREVDRILGDAFPGGTLAVALELLRRAVDDPEGDVETEFWSIMARPRACMELPGFDVGMSGVLFACAGVDSVHVPRDRLPEWYFRYLESVQFELGV